MPCRILILLIGLVAIFTLRASTVKTVPEECTSPLTLISTSDWYPYIYQRHQTTTGVDLELLRLLLTEMGCKLKVIHVPERRVLFEMDASQFDIGLGASVTPSRQQKFHYSAPYRHENNMFAYSKDDGQLADVTSLQQILDMNKIIAINLAGWYGEEIEQAKAVYDLFVYSETAEVRLNMLALHRIDVVIDDKVVLCSWLSKLPHQSLILHPLLLSDASIHYIFNKQTISAQFVSKFNRVLAEFDHSGRLHRHFKTQLPDSCNDVSHQFDGPDH